MNVKYKNFILGLFTLFTMFYLIPIVVSYICRIFFIGTITNHFLLLINIMIYIVQLFIFVFMYKNSLIKEFASFKANLKSNIKIAFKYWGYGIISMLFINFILVNTLGNIATNEAQNRLLLASEPVLSFISMIFLAPIIEELSFRKILKDAFDNKFLYCIFSGLLFGLAHIIYSIDFNNPFELLYTISYAMLGFYFAKAYFETDSIYTSITMHMFHNFFAILIIIFLGGAL